MLIKNMSNILSDMLTKTQKLKDNDNHIHEDVEVDYDKSDGGGVNTNDHVETLCEYMISEDESLRVFCAINSKVCGLFTNDTQFIDDMTPHKNEVCDLDGVVIEQVVTVLPKNTLLPAKENKSVCDVDRFRTISLRYRLSCIEFLTSFPFPRNYIPKMSPFEKMSTIATFFVILWHYLIYFQHPPSR